MRSNLPVLLVMILAVGARCVIAQTAPTASAAQVGYSESEPYQPRVLPSPAKARKKVSKKEPVQPKETVETVQPPTTKQPGRISIPVSVFNREGKLVTDLSTADFKLFVDGQEQQVDSVQTSAEPLNIVLLLDTSPSTELRRKEVTEYALDLVEQLQPEDRMMVISFNSRTKELTPLTNDRSVLEKALSKWKMGDGTSIYETVDDVFTDLPHAIPGGAALVIISDGVDTTSKKATYESSLIQVEKGPYRVFPIFFDSSVQTNRSTRLPFPIQLPSTAQVPSKEEMERMREIGAWFLDDLHKSTGGRAINYDMFKAGTYRIKVGIPDELRGQYILTFTPSSSLPAGQRKQIKVRVNRPNLLVRARGSYIP